METRDLLFAIKCKICHSEFVYCRVSGSDIRCYRCKKGLSVEEVEAELKTMDDEEKKLFKQDIEEYGEIDELQKKS